MRNSNPAYVGDGSWLCENSSARRARRNISKKLRIMESNRAARTMFNTLSENCIFYISQLYEFSHRLGHKQTWHLAWALSALPLKADKQQTFRNVRFVPKADECTAAKIRCDTTPC